MISCFRTRGLTLLALMILLSNIMTDVIGFDIFDKKENLLFLTEVLLLRSVLDLPWT